MALLDFRQGLKRGVGPSGLGGFPDRPAQLEAGYLFQGRPWAQGLYVLTLAHLIFLKGLGDAVGNSPRSFFWPDFSILALFPALAFTVLLASGVLGMLLALARLAGLRVHLACNLVLMALALLNGIRMATPLRAKAALLAMDHRMAAGMVAASAVAFALWATLALFRPGWVKRAAEGILLVSPLILVLWGQGLYKGFRRAAAPASQVSLSANRAGHRGSTIWVVLFDELDERFAFEQPPPQLELDAFARLKRQAVTATQAYPPGHSTNISIPSLLTGRVITQCLPVNERQAKLVPYQGEPFLWSGQDTLFNDVGKAGFTAAVYGWFMPYRRLLEGQVPFVQGDAIEYEEAGFNQRIALLTGLRTYVREALFLAKDPVAPETLVDLHNRDLQNAKAFISREAERGPADLVWVHFPVPHAPRLLRAGGGYTENVQAADAALGAMEDRLAAQGRWETDTVIVTSDHWVRRQTGQDPTFSPDENLLERLQERAHRVPFMVKMPGQRSGALVSTPFATVLLRDLINQLLQGGVRDDQGLVRWMKLNASPGEGGATLHVPF